MGPTTKASGATIKPAALGNTDILMATSTKGSGKMTSRMEREYS